MFKADFYFKNAYLTKNTLWSKMAFLPGLMK